MNDESPYTPPPVWTWNKENGGRFANINRPIAGATHDKELPVGRHPLQLYSLGTPNGVKVTVMLEELLALGHAGAEYDAWLIRINEGEQFGSGFVAVNPNSKIPALLDRSGPTPVRVFESGAILLYLAEKFGSAFLPTDGADARRMPVVAVLADGHRALPRRRLRPLLRLRAEQDRVRHRPLRHGGEAPARRARPAPRREPATSRATTTRIADMAVWPWYGALVKGQLYGAGEFLQVQDYTQRAALDRRRSRSARPCSAAAWSTAPGASRRASCTSATTPATSTPARRTSWPVMITLYDCATAPSPRRARILLAEKGVAHETVQVDLRNGEQLGEAFRKINPQCTVPALRTDDGLLLTDNAAIAAYLEARYPEPPLLGSTPAEKAEIASWNWRVEFEGLLADRRGDAQQHAGDGQPGAAGAGELCADPRAGAARPGAAAAILRRP